MAEKNLLSQFDLLQLLTDCKNSLKVSVFCCVLQLVDFFFPDPNLQKKYNEAYSYLRKRGELEE